MNRSSRVLATSESGLLAQIFLQILCGMLLAVWYKAAPTQANIAAHGIRSHTIPALLAGIHFWGGQLLLIHSFLHLSALLWTGLYRDSWRARWFVAIALFMGSLGLLVTGNLLPYDRHGVQTAVTEVGIASRVPFFGPVIADMMLGGPKFSASTLATWYGMHRWWIPLALAALALWRAVQRDDIRRSKLAVAVSPLMAVALAIVLHAPVGAAAAQADANRYTALVGWYAWPLHASLAAFDSISPSVGWIGIVLPPALFVGFLVAIPWLCEKVTPIFIQTAYGGLLAMILVVCLAYGGPIAPPLNRDYLAATPRSLSDPGAPLNQVLAEQGRQSFANLPCSRCHGADAGGTRSGPNLHGIGFEHPNAAWFKKWIHDPRSIRPNTTMPAFPTLDDRQLGQLAEFLRSLR